MEGTGQAASTGDAGTGGTPASSGGTPTPSAPPPAGGLSQEQVNRLVGEARTEGRSSGERSLLESLGVESVEALKATVTAAKEAEAARLTETERLTRERDEAKRLAEQAQARAEETMRLSRLETELLASGVKPERIPAALRLVDLSTVTVTGNEVTGAKEAAEKLVEQFPEWKGSAAASGSNGGVGAADASRGGPGSVGEVDFRTASREEYERELHRFGIRT